MDDQIKVFIFWSYVPEWWARAIVRITGRQLPDKSDSWSHMGIGFTLQDGKRVYYEAIVGKGFIGPIPIEKLIDKIGQNEKSRLAIKELPIEPYRVLGIYKECRRWQGRKSYSAWQLVRMWFFERLGRWVGIRVRRTPDRLVCSEAVARLIYPPYDLRDEIRRRFDEVNPNSAWRKYLTWFEK